MKILALVKNNFTNDSRVLKTTTSLLNFGNEITLFAVMENKGLNKRENNQFPLLRIPLFSSLYSKAKANKTSSNKPVSLPKKSFKKKIISQIKNNKLRRFTVESLNSLTFIIGGLWHSRKEKYDLLYCNDLDTILLGWLIAKRNNAKIIFDSHEIWLQGIKFGSASYLKKKFWIFLENNLINRIDAVITTTDTRAEFLQKKYNLSKVWTIKNCPLLVESVPESNLLREEFDIKTRYLALYQGLLRDVRGIFEMVDIIEQINDVSMVFMGMGQDKEKLRKYIAAKNLSTRIFIKDAVPITEIPKYTSSADFGFQLLKNVDFNHYSTISNKVFEYMMYGIALVGSNFPEISKIVKNEKTGIVVDPEDKKEIISSIREMLISNKLDEYKTNTKQARLKYNWQNEEKVLQDILKSLGN
jgi:glycosyltransferase involved in cell wall biosynthesis